MQLMKASKQMLLAVLVASASSVVAFGACDVTAPVNSAFTLATTVAWRSTRGALGWSEKFCVTPDELRDTVKRVGTSLEAIERELERST